MKVSKTIKIAVAAVAALAFSAQAAFAGGVSIQAGGSSFDATLLNTCKVAWQTSTGNTFTYNSSDSGTGQKNQDAGIFDANFSDSGYVPAKSSVLNIPLVMAPIAVIYNLPGSKPLFLSEKTLSDIFAGKVTKWNDSEIAADNNQSIASVVYAKNTDGSVKKDNTGAPVVLRTTSTTRHYTLPNQTIHLVVRSDASGTTKNFVTLFTKTNADVWTKAADKTFANVFPGTINGAGNIGRIQAYSGSTGVSAGLNATPYSIGYAELSYATGKLRTALLQNANGDFAAPTAANTSAFVAGATLGATGLYTFNYVTKTPGAYILGIVSYALVDSAKTGANAAAMTDFLKFVASPACANSSPNYAAESGPVAAYVATLLAKLPTA
ncbi:MAG: substrate-binding domain-containing protein [Actinomycetes bacterium]